MEPRAAKRWGAGGSLVEDGPAPVRLDASATPLAARLARAAAASLLHRVGRGEGALLAINASIVAAGPPTGRALAAVVVSALVLTAMYAVNDLTDAAADRTNPKKDQTVVATYLQHRGAMIAVCLALHVAGIVGAAVALDARAALAAAGVMAVNLVYSLRLKGVPVLDVAWCGLWGALYAAVVTADAQLLVTVGVMTAVCHLYQTLDDRGSDAANGITTTAVRSRALSTAVLAAACAVLGVVLHGPLGPAWAVVAAVLPVAFLLSGVRPLTGWILTKVLFAVVWLALLGLARAAG